MRKKEKRLAILGIILAVFLFGVAAIGWIATAQLYQIGMIDVFWIIIGIISTAGCLIWIYVAWRVLKTKALKETFFFALFVVSLSILSHITINIILGQNFSIGSIITFWTIVGVPASAIFAGYSQRTVLKRLRRLGLSQGVTLLALIFLILAPIIETSPVTYYHREIGTISSAGLFENGNDTAKVQGQIFKSVFTAEIPFNSNIVFIAGQMVNITNRSNACLDLKIRLEDLSGNLSTVREFRILLTLGNGSEISLFSIDDGNVKYGEVYLSMKGRTTVAIGFISLGQNLSPVDIAFVSLSMRCYENNIGMSISISPGL